MRPIVWVVDTQKDFIDEDGKLSVPGAVDIRQNILSTLLTAEKFDVSIYGSVDAHEKNDVEFLDYPVHCVIDTDGQKNIPESIISHPDNVYYVPNNGQGVDMSSFEGARQVYFEKQCVNIWDKCKGQPDNIQTLLRMTDITDVYVVGVATELCVLEAVLGFLARDYNVFVVEDATKGLSVDGEVQAKDKMASFGAEFITTKQLECMFDK